MKPLSALTRQLRRFSVVGLVNTAVDFVATNVLFLLLSPDGYFGLMLVSVLAGLIATANSYLLNSRWTFAGLSEGREPIHRFLLVAGMGLVINTAVFLFLMRHLPLLGVTESFISLNLARLGGVLAAMAVTYCGYRLWAFAPRHEIRRAIADVPATVAAGFAARPIVVITAIGLVARLVFLWIAPVIYGDSVNYAWVARLTAIGDLAAVDLFWHSLFDFWQALFVWAGAGQFHAPVLASLVPGLLLIWPVALITWQLYGNRAAQLAATLTALHPRLIEYSLNGYAESFYLLAAICAVWGLMVLAMQPRRPAALLMTGVGLSAWILVRNEALLFAGVALLIALIQRRGAWQEVVGAALRVSVIVTAVIGLYCLGNFALWGQTGLVQKRSNLARQHTEMLDMRAAAQETYGRADAAQQKPGWSEIARTLAARWPGNLRYLAERLPGVLLSPIFLFALLLPVLRRNGPTRASPRSAPVWPVLLMTIWPLGFYPLIQLEPRMLLPTLVGAIIFGSAGALLAGRRLVEVLGGPPRLMRMAPAAVTIVLLLPLIPLLARYSDGERGFHREIGQWIASGVRADERIIGDGYGYVSASAFWAGRRAEPRIWTDRPEILADTVDEATILLIYERYLREANPELVAVMDEGLPGLVRVAEFRFPRTGRVQAWRRVSAQP